MRGENEYAQEILEILTKYITENNLVDEFNSDEESLTRFFEGYLMAGTILCQKLSDKNADNLSFSHLLNSLAVQLRVKYVLNNTQKEASKKEVDLEESKGE